VGGEAQEYINWVFCGEKLGIMDSSPRQILQLMEKSFYVAD